jgi:hypothetical protein
MFLIGKDGVNEVFVCVVPKLLSLLPATGRSDEQQCENLAEDFVPRSLVSGIKPLGII